MNDWLCNALSAYRISLPLLTPTSGPDRGMYGLISTGFVLAA